MLSKIWILKKFFFEYNRNTCQCECIEKCACSSKYCWKDYPICGCKCPKYETCSANRYFNEDSCCCECRPIACLPGFKQDKSSCACVRYEKESKSCKSEKTSRHEKHSSKSKKHLEKHSSKSGKGCRKPWWLNSSMHTYTFDKLKKNNKYLIIFMK